MKLLRETIRRLIVESENGNEWDGLLDLIKTGELDRWKQAFSILETGIAQDYPENAKMDIVYGILDVMLNWENTHMSIYDDAIAELEEKQDTFPFQLDATDQKELQRLYKMTNELAHEQNSLHRLVAELLDIEDDGHSSWWYEYTLPRVKSSNKPDQKWSDLFRKVGII